MHGLRADMQFLKIYLSTEYSYVKSSFLKIKKNRYLPALKSGAPHTGAL
jgi:hypothetical protein